MHPARFRLADRLLDRPECRLEITCCRGRVLYPMRLLALRKGNVTFEEGGLATIRFDDDGVRTAGA